MKRIKVSALKGCVKDLTIFHGSDVLSTWIKHGKKKLSAHSAYTSVLLIEGDTLDIEWLGLETTLIKDQYVCLNFIKVINESIDDNDASRTVYGWVSDDIIRFGDYETDDINVRVLGPDEPLVDDDIDTLLKSTDTTFDADDVD
jgi:hypothetical protein